MTRRCAGCRDALGGESFPIPTIGAVCGLCLSVLDEVFEIEVFEIETAIAHVEMVIEAIRESAR